MNYLANLEQAMKFFRKNGGGARPQPYSGDWGPSQAGGGGETVPGMLWAERMADRMGGREDQDFFGEEPRNVLRDYQGPAEFNAGPMPQPRYDMASKKNLRPRANNFLLSLLGGR
jgi:hypothetical protein